MFCSTIIATIGRPSLTRAVWSVLNQEFEENNHEVIIVNDSGHSLPNEDWMQSQHVQIIETNRRNRCVARNCGAALAHGEYLHFLDDDDWMLPSAFLHLWKVANNNPAAWIYGGYELINRQNEHLEICQPDEQGNCSIRFAAGEWLPLQVSLIRAEAFFSVGGFAPLNSLQGGDEDVDLSRLISMKNDIAGTKHIIAKIQFGQQGSTTNYHNLREQSRTSREKILSLPNSWNRLIDSAQSRSHYPNYWYGRVLRCYVSSIYWNIKQRRYCTTISRLLFCILTLLASGMSIFTHNFWRGVKGEKFFIGWLSTVRYT